MGHGTNRKPRFPPQDGPNPKNITGTSDSVGGHGPSNAPGAGPASSYSNFHHGCNSLKICFKDKGEEIFYNLNFC